ncbi:MAG: ZIP family metal transporter [Candidatus Moraniibacteriota bacterium]
MLWIYALTSVFVVSLISLIGVFTLSIDRNKLYKYLIYIVSLSAGTLMGDAFIHLIPEAYEKSNSSTVVSLYILLGILVFFVLEKVIHWRHCHEEPCEKHPHPFSYIILMGDSLHNFVDGMVIGASYLVSIPVGIATTVAVVFHEIPQEIGDFASLIYGGFSRKKALILNFLSALMAVFGALLILSFDLKIDGLEEFLIPFAAGGFIYIAGTDLIPELHKHNEAKKGVFQVLAFLLGIGLMLGMLLVE